MSTILSSPPQRTGRQFDTEERALGDFLMHPSRRSEITEIVNALDFLWPCHRETFSALKNMHQRRVEINAFTLVAELVARGRLDVHAGELVGSIVAATSPTDATALDSARATRAASE